MKKILLLAGITIGLNLSAQITLTSADFMGANDSIYYTNGDNLSVDPTPNGPNQTWDYSQQNGVSQKVVRHFAMSSAGFSYQFTYNNADFWTDNVDLPIDPSQFGGFLPVSIDNMVGFFQLDQNEMTNLGYGADISGFPVPMKMDTTDTYYEFPIDYGDAWGGPSYFKVDMNPIQDIIYISHARRSTEVTGWGNITTPYGNYDVLKLKHIVISEDSLWANIQGFGFWLPVPARTVTTYEWIPLGEDGPVMVIKEQDLLGVTEVYYKDAYNPTLATEEIGNKSAELMIYPNPTADQLNLQTELEIVQSYIYGMDGQIVKSFGKESQLNVAELPSGKYILFTRCKEGILTKEFVKE
ncbi:MAG: T9SS type A sorting domain-containing protein [Crocinitomicaceae bacterium]|nr:T9SS type A sorting domain-containing protein [Crocinitomicaceae bacterium]